MRENDSVSRSLPFSEKIGENAAGMLIATPSRPENHNMKTMQKMKSMKKSYEKYEIWVEPTRENDSVSRILLFSEKSAKGCSSILTKGFYTVPPLVKPNGGAVEY